MATTAQEPTSTPEAPRVINHGDVGRVEPAQLLTEGDAPSLVDRLRAIRGSVTSQYTETRTEDADQPASTTADEGAARVSSLPSVLVRRSRRNSNQPTVIVEQQTTPAAPVTTTPAADTGTQRVEASVGDNDSSSRRTSRRVRAQMSPSSDSVAFPSVSRTQGEQISLASQGPVMRVEIAGPRTLTVGKQAPYRFRLINQGDAVAHKVAVTIAIPDAASIGSHQVRIGAVNQHETNAASQSVVWAVDEVPARSQHDLVIMLEPVKNQPIDMQVSWKYQPLPLAGKITVLQPKLAVAITGPSETRFGETSVYKIKISNPGNGPAEQVKIDLRATGVASQPNQLGTLPAGATRELEVELTARQAGVMQILVRANGNGDLKSEARHEVQVRRPELAVKISAPELLYAGSTADYQIRIANRGDAEAKDVILHFDLPAGTQNGIGIDKKPITNDQPKWRLGDLAAGIERVFTLKLDLMTGGKNQLTVRAEDSNNLAASDTAATNVESIADLKLSVNDPKGPVPIGKEVVYEVTIMNRGSKEARDVSVVAQFSDGVEPSAASGQRSEIVPGQVVFDAIRTIPAGAEIKLRISAKAHKSGNLRFRAELTCGDPETKLVSEESTRFYGETARRDTNGTNSASQSNSSGPTPARR